MFDPSRFVAGDTETPLIQPGLLAPPLVCGSVASEHECEILTAEAMRDWFRRWLDSDQVLVGANLPYDFGVLLADAEARGIDLLPSLYQAFDELRVYDIQTAQALDAIAGGHLFKDPRTAMLSDLRSPTTGKPARYSLEVCTDLVLGRKDAKKNDLWRLRYAILQHVPMALWPVEAIEYPKDDARNTLDVATGQIAAGLRNLQDLSAQVETHFAMHLGAMWGFRTDKTRVEALEAKVNAAHAAIVERFKGTGFIRSDGTEDTSKVKTAVALAFGAEGKCDRCNGSGKVISAKTKKPITCKGSDGGCDGTGLDIGSAPALPLTDKGGIKTDRDTKTESGDETLMAYADDETEKIKDTYLPWLKQGIDKPLTLRPNVLVESGRTSYDGLIQLFPRHGGARECITARDGYVFCSVDFSALELCTFAQVCYWLFGHSTMRDTINASDKPGILHTALGAKISGCSIEEFSQRVKAKDPEAVNIRGAAKNTNFGSLGLMGAAKFVLMNRKRGAGKTTAPNGREYDGLRFCILVGGAAACGVEKVMEWKRRKIPPTCKGCLDIVESVLRPAFFSQWPEVKEYFAWVTASIDANGGDMPCLVPEEIYHTSIIRMRGGCTATSGANNAFQALAADGGKHALRMVTREAYLDRSSPLWGSRFPAYIHDEVFAEMPRDRASLAGPRMAKVMLDAMAEYVPDVKIAADPALMEYWTKDAEPAYDANGAFTVWMPS